MNELPPPQARRTDEFYVGYLPMPNGLAFYVRLTIPALAWLSLGVAAMLARSQSPAGDGQWRTDVIVTLEGLVDTTPYPMLRVPSTIVNQPYESVLVVETGKHGAKRLEAHRDQVVRATGWIIERDGLRMLELVPGEDSLVELLSVPADQGGRLRRVSVESLGRRTMQGEIVDSKCFLGVMKPGHGKTHKECATLCIRGGIPPLFVTRQADGSRAYFLLTSISGTGLDPHILPFVADPVNATGEIERRGDLFILKVDMGGIQRL